MTVYDQNNKLMGEMTLGIARGRAKSQELDVILKTMSLKIPVVQLIAYRSDLIRQFYAKYADLKTVGNSLYFTNKKR